MDNFTRIIKNIEEGHSAYRIKLRDILEPIYDMIISLKLSVDEEK